MKSIVRGIGGMPLVIIGLGVLLSLLTPDFGTTDNLLNILRQTAILGVVAAGQTFVLISGGVDLSVGSTMGLASVVSSAYLLARPELGEGVLVALTVGLVVGAVNGMVINATRLHPIVVTLGVMMAVHGGAFLVSNGSAYPGLPQSLVRMGTGYTLGLPNLFYLCCAVFIVTWWLLQHSLIGRRIYALGSSPYHAELSGIRRAPVLLAAYAACGALAGLAGLMLTARAVSGHASLGDGYNLQSVAAVVLGGARLGGGVGNIAGSLMGVLLIGVLNNALNLMGISSLWQDVVSGGAILGAIILDRMRSERQAETVRRLRAGLAAPGKEA